MSAVDALRLAEENGVRLGVAGADLILVADREPAPGVLEAIRRYKVGIVALLTAAESKWTAEDWQAFFDERAGIAENDGGLPRVKAETRAFECCVVEWLNRHPAPSDAARCASCGEPEVSATAVVPFGTQRHTWLHPHCWGPWHQKRRNRARRSLKNWGISAPETVIEESPESARASHRGDV